MTQHQEKTVARAERVVDDVECNLSQEDHRMLEALMKPVTMIQELRKEMQEMAAHFRDSYNEMGNTILPLEERMHNLEKKILREDG